MCLCLRLSTLLVVASRGGQREPVRWGPLLLPSRRREDEEVRQLLQQAVQDVTKREEILQQTLGKISCGESGRNIVS